MTENKENQERISKFLQINVEDISEKTGLPRLPEGFSWGIYVEDTVRVNDGDWRDGKTKYVHQLRVALYYDQVDPIFDCLANTDLTSSTEEALQDIRREIKKNLPTYLDYAKTMLIRLDNQEHLSPILGRHWD